MISGVIVWLLTYYISFSSLWLTVIYNFLISISVPTLIIMLVYSSSLEYISAKERFKFILGKIKRG